MKALIVGNDYYTGRYSFLLKELGVKFETKPRLFSKDLDGKDVVFFSGKLCTSRNIMTSLRNNRSVFSEQILFEKKSELGLADYARRNKLKLIIGGFDVFNPVVDEMKKLIEGDGVKEMFFNRVGPRQYGYVRLNIIDDLVLQDIWIINHILGDSELKVLNAYSNNVYNHCIAHLRSGETNILLYANKDLYYKERNVHVFCEKTRAIADILSQKLLFLKADGINQSLYGTGHESYRELFVKRDEPLRIAIESFIHGKKNPIDYSIIKRNLELSCEIKKSLKHVVS